MKSSQKDFFQSYLDAWDALDGRAIAEHYLDQAIIDDGDGLNAYSNHDELTRKFESNCTLMKTLGYQKSAFSEGAVIASGLRSVTVDVGWSVTMADGVRCFRATYMCTLLKDKWQIMSATVY